MTFGILQAQQRLYPVHLQQKWGLIDEKGQLVVDPIYNNIGRFEEDGYAIVEQDSLLGVIDRTGAAVIPCKYVLMDYIGRDLFSVKEEGRWKVVNIKDKLVLDNMAAKIRFLPQGYLSYEELDGIGLAHRDRGVILPAQFNSFEFLSNGWVVAIDEENRHFLYTAKGEPILKEGFGAIELANNWIWTRKHQKWGAYDFEGKLKVKHHWVAYRKMGSNFYELKNEKKRSYLYSVALDSVLSIVSSKFFSFDNQRVEYVQEDGTRGLVDQQGRIVLEGRYDFITKFGPSAFRVQEGEYQGVLKEDGSQLIPFVYNYISNLDDDVALVRQKERYGIINKKGEVVLPLIFSSALELSDNHASYKDSAKVLQLFDFDENGNLISNTKFSKLKTLKVRAARRMITRTTTTIQGNVSAFQISDSLRWHYHGGSRKWGLWHIQNEKYKFVPQWDNVQVYKDLGITVVGKRRRGIGGKLNTGRIRLKINEVFGIFNNTHGLPVTKMEFLDIRMSDFDSLGLDIARCIFVGGRHGIMAKNGKILSRGYAYIGEFVEGKARATKKGRLLVNLEPKDRRTVGNAKRYFDSFRARYYFDNDDDPKFFRMFETTGQLYCEEAKWGYLDTFGRVHSSFKYDYIENYSNNRALMRKDGKWGMLDEEGNEVLEPAYDDFNFLPNADKKLFFIAQNTYLQGMIDANANIVVPVQYNRVRAFHNDRVAVKNDAGRWGFVDRQGHVVVKPKYRVVYDFSEGLAVVFDQSRWGALDRAGNLVVKNKYLKMGNFVEGKAWVHLPRGKKGYINKKGELLFAGKFSKLTDFKEGIARVFVRKKGWGLLDTTGNFILKPKRSFKKIEPFNEHGLAKVAIGKRYRLINQEGKLIGKRSFGVMKAFQEGYALVRKQTVGGFKLGKPNFNWTFIDTTGELVTKQEFRQLQPFAGGRAAFTNDKSKRGYINTKGEVVIEPVYFKVEAFKDNRAVVWDSYNRTGVIDTTGKVIIPVKYNKVIGTSNGLALVRKNSRTYYFVREDLKRHTPINFSEAYIFEDWAAAVKSANKWGVINQKGLRTLSPKYAKMTNFKDGVAKVTTRKLLGVVDLEGNVIIKPEYEYIAYVGNGLFRVEKGDKMGYLDLNGQWIWEMK